MQHLLKWDCWAREQVHTTDLVGMRHPRIMLNPLIVFIAAPLAVTSHSSIEMVIGKQSSARCITIGNVSQETLHGY